jgi:hypothetical protein
MYQSPSGGHVPCNVAHSLDSMNSSAVGAGYIGYNEGTSNLYDVLLRPGGQKCSSLSGWPKR